MKPFVFVGSSSEAAENVAPTIQMELAPSATVQIWNQGFFPPGSYVLDTLSEKADLFDFAVLIFSADDVLESRGKRYLAARDNTVLEAGFFTALLGRLRTFIVAPSVDDLKLPSDFNGLTRVTYPAQAAPDLLRAELGPMCFTLKSRIRELGRRQRKEEKLSDGMVIILGLLAASRTAPNEKIVDVLARFNNGNPSEKGWVKAAQYLLIYLSQMGLIQHHTGSMPGFNLTEKGRELIRSNYFKEELDTVLASSRGAMVRESIRI